MDPGVEVKSSARAKNFIVYARKSRASRKSFEPYCIIGAVTKFDQIASLPCIEKMHGYFEIDKIRHAAQSIKYLGGIIDKRSVLQFPSAEGPEFHFVEKILVDDKNKVVLITKKMCESYFVTHFQAYRIQDLDNFAFDCLFANDLESCTVTHVNKLSDGCFYIMKRCI